MKVFVTGHNGFVGRHLINRLQFIGCQVAIPAARIDLQNIHSLTENFTGCEVVFHCAGFAHADDDGSEKFSAQHWAVNYQGALNVAEAAVKAQVKRVIFISTVKVVADAPHAVIDEEYGAQPSTVYGKAKRAAENDLQKFCVDTQLELVIVRPVMIYGRDGKGNLSRMWNAVRRNRFPSLPQGGYRSLIHIDDVVEALLLCATHPAAAGESFILAHPVPVTTRQIYLLMRKFAQLPESSCAFPVFLLKIFAILGDFFGFIFKKTVPFNSVVYSKLMQPAIYSSEKISRQLNWKPLVDIETGLQTMQ